MTLTPDRSSEKPEERDRTAPASRRPAPGSKTSSFGSIRDQLAAAGLDLTGHPLAETFTTIDPVEMTETPTADEPASDYFASIDDEPAGGITTAGDSSSLTDSGPASEPFLVSEPSTVREAGLDPSIVAATDTNDTPAGTSDTAALEEQSAPEAEAAPGAGSAPVRGSRHPLFTDAAWADLSVFAPEVTTGITTLMGLDAGLRSFDRPMGPQEALLLIDGAEALSRITDALSTLALSVYERIGPPADSGAKDTKSLIRDRLNLTPTEANRRTELAKNLGGRVDMAGQALQPLCPAVSDGLHDGSLSAGQAKAIDDCMKNLPDWVTPNQRADVEKRLVEHAPNVRVGDLRKIFEHMLAYIDPDGTAPREETPRADYSVTMRPKANGDWVLAGLLDPVSGSALNGLLTSRIKSADPTTDSATADGTTVAGNPVPAGEAAVGGSAAGTGAERDVFGIPLNPNTGAVEGQEALFDVVDAVLRGDRHDAPLPNLHPGPQDTGSAVRGDNTPGGTAAGSAGTPGSLPVEVGIREDGTTIDLSDQRPSARAWIYERFATLIGRISMDQAGTGSPYALVVTAKAEDLATGTGEGVTGVETPIPIHELIARGLNGAVFFHLMSQKAKTVQVASEKRFANKHQVAVITGRDKGCTFPGCDSPPGWCEVNHVVPWAEGGRTDINNLALACSAHHHLLDRSEWEMRMLVDGRPAWVPPATVDPARRPILHQRFITEEIIESLFDGDSGGYSP